MRSCPGIGVGFLTALDIMPVKMSFLFAFTQQFLFGLGNVADQKGSS